MSTSTQSTQLPVMQTEKAINYCRLYIDNGLKRYGIRYTTPTEELVEMFSRQPLSVRDFLRYTRTQEQEEAFKEFLKTAGQKPEQPTAEPEQHTAEPKAEVVNSSAPLGNLGEVLR